MKHLFCLLAFTFLLSCQKKTDLEILTKVSNDLQQIKKIQYNFNFEQKGYESESSNYSYSGIQAIDFTKKNELGANVYSKRFPRKDKEGFERLAIGDTLIKIKSKTKTIIKSPKAQVPILYGNIVLYFNLFDLRKSLPLIIKDSTMTSLHTSDTLIADIPALSIQFKIQKHILGGKLYDTHGRTNKYHLIVRKGDHVPLVWALKNKDGAMEFSYSDIQLDINPALWQYNPRKEYIVISGEEYRLREKNKLNRNIGQYFPDWQLSSIRGKSLSNKNFNNSLTLYEFFFVGCAGSVSSKHFIDELNINYGKNLNIVNIEIQDHSKSDVRSFVEKYNLKEPALFKGKQLANKLGVIGCPTYILVDRSGKIIFSSFGDRTGLKELIENELQL
ncbi:hypothetical protein AAON49_09305 [Pseudotenacibaculum sp. MALMAid0570]|uniref:TlpA family protein disulfide reductase n=1 Tax=Pseudotenacibaculum sp. MALMAid0570 TaxID=3143938 RepID=UPI0032DF8C01